MDFVFLNKEPVLNALVSLDELFHEQMTIDDALIVRTDNPRLINLLILLEEELNNPQPVAEAPGETAVPEPAPSINGSKPAEEPKPKRGRKKRTNDSIFPKPKPRCPDCGVVVSKEGARCRTCAGLARSANKAEEDPKAEEQPVCPDCGKPVRDPGRRCASCLMKSNEDPESRGVKVLFDDGPTFRQIKSHGAIGGRKL